MLWGEAIELVLQQDPNVRRFGAPVTDDAVHLNSGKGYIYNYMFFY